LIGWIKNDNENRLLELGSTLYYFGSRYGFGVFES